MTDLSASSASTRRGALNKRDLILDETLILAGNFGYRGFSLSDLAARCGLTKQGVMHYFPTKDRLVLALLDERDASLEADLLGLLAAGGYGEAESGARARAVLRDSLEQLVAQMALTPDLIKLHIVLRAEAIDPDHPAAGYFVRRDRATLDWLALRLTPFSDHPTSLARHILATMLGLQQQWLQEGQGFDLPGEWRSALATLLPE